MAVARRRQRRISVCYWIVTQRVHVNGAAIVAAPNINKRAIADGKWSAGVKRQRRLYRPTGSQLFVVTDWNAGALISARGHDAGVIYRSSIEPQPVHVHVRPAAPTVGNRIVDLCGCDGRGEWSRASEQVEFPLVHCAARPCYWRWHDRPGAPRVTGDIVDIQGVHFAATAVTAGNVELAVDDPEPGQEERLRQGRAGSPAIGGDVVDAQCVYRSAAVVATCHVNLPIPIRGGMIG